MRMSNSEKGMEEKVNNKEAKARAGDHSPVVLHLNVLHFMLPNDVGLHLVLHRRPNSTPFQS